LAIGLHQRLRITQRCARTVGGVPARVRLAMAGAGLVKIVDERHVDGRDGLIDRLTFTRLR
jgi:hypothetical protein